MSQIITEFDPPWKNILEDFFEPFMEFFFPKVHAVIDWNRGYEFKEQELQKLLKEAVTKQRRVDKLVEVWRKDGESALLYIHIEIQSQEETTFSERMFIYHYRLYDRYGPKVLSLAILGDNNQDWRPWTYIYEELGCGILFYFPIVKLLDYENELELEDSSNPFTFVVMAHLKALETHSHPKRRYFWKKILYKALCEEAKYSEEEIRKLYHFLDWVFGLPEELAKEFDDFVEEYEEDKKVEYVTHIERRGIQKGLEIGILQHSQEALVDVLDARFEKIPGTLIKTIQAIKDKSLLSRLLREAIFVESLQVFEKQVKNSMINVRIRI
jgi:hypothetical protein